MQGVPKGVGALCSYILGHLFKDIVICYWCPVRLLETILNALFSKLGIFHRANSLRLFAHNGALSPALKKIYSWVKTRK